MLVNSKKIVDAALNKAESKVLAEDATPEAGMDRFTMLEIDNPADTIRKLFVNPGLAKYVVVMPDDESMEGALLERMAIAFERNPSATGGALMAT